MLVEHLATIIRAQRGLRRAVPVAAPLVVTRISTTIFLSDGPSRL